MKKSEMVNKLTRYIRKSTNWCTDDSLLFAQELLDKVEALGMLPPTNIKEPIYPEGSIEADIIQGTTYSREPSTTSVNKWEDE